MARKQAKARFDSTPNINWRLFGFDGPPGEDINLEGMPPRNLKGAKLEAWSRTLSMRVRRHHKSLFINYPKETGFKMNWPRVLKVDERGRGSIEDLLLAIGQGIPTERLSKNRRHPEATEHIRKYEAGLIDVLNGVDHLRPQEFERDGDVSVEYAGGGLEIEYGATGLRFLGRDKIAKYLGISRRQLSENMKGKVYPRYIHRVSARLLVSTLSRLEKLALISRKRKSAIRSEVAKKPRAKRARG